MTDRRRRLTLTAVTGLGLCLTLLPAGQAQAQAPTRVPCNDIAALKTAINNANTSGGSIVLARNCTYSLTAADNTDDGLPEITGKVRISGDHTIIQRAPSTSAAFRVFHVTQTGNLTLDSLTVRGGEASGNGFAAGGGGLFNDHGRLTLTDVTVRNNSSFLGGGIWNNVGTLTLRNSTVRDNTSNVAGGVATSGTTTMRGGALHDNTAAFWAGGLANAGNTTLNDVSVAGNNVGDGRGGLGAGIMTMSINAASGPLRLNSTQVRGNIAETSGGGIFVGVHQPTTLYKSVVTRNTANGGPTQGGGINNNGRLFGVIIRPTGSPERQQSKAGDSAKQQVPKVNLIKSTVFKNTPTNCAPPNSVAHCDAVGSAPAKNAAKPGKN